MPNLKLLGIATTGLLILTLAACGSGSQESDQPAASQGGVGSPPGSEQRQAPSRDAEAELTSYAGKFTLSPGHGTIGSQVSAKGTGFEANTSLQLLWQAFTGRWNVEGEKYLGREYGERLDPLTTVKTDANGNFEASFTVPHGFGFYHDVRVMQDNILRNKAAFYVEMEVWVSPASGPPGTPITIEARGIGWRPLQSNWDVIYDNRFTGFFTGVSTNGSAKVVIPAAGQPGKHIINILHGSFTFPYMNMQQSPEPDRPTWKFEFTITDGQPVHPPSVITQSLPRDTFAGQAASQGASLSTDWASGTVGAPVTLRGSGFSPRESVDLRWFRVSGNRVSGSGWAEDSTSMGTVTVGADGSFTLPFETPDDLGGDHRIEAIIGGKKAADTKYVVTPSASALSPATGPAGTMMTIHLKGGGWTETANIYTVVYDNAYIGYSCAFNSQGDITVYLPATGEPGWHFIDLYPAIYKGKETPGVETFRIPQLSFALDHPGERLPAFRFAFLITAN
jgi:hypothetical protein